MMVSRSFPELLIRPKVARALMLIVIALGAASVAFFIYQSTLDTITRDEWGFLNVLQHWYDGQFSWTDIWSTNTAGSEHRTPAFKLYFLADALWFGLDVRVGCYLGVLALAVFVVLMYRYFTRISPSPSPTAFDHYAFLPVALTMFSYLQSHIYTYDLLAEFAITGSMLFALLWIQMDLKLRTPQPAWRHFGYALALVLLLLLFGAGKGPALILATLVLVGSLALQGDSRRALRILAWTGAATVVAELIYWHGGAGAATGGDLMGLIGNAFQDPAGALQYLLHALGAAFITADSLLLIPGSQREAVLDMRGGLLLAGAVATLALYLYLRMYRRSLVPLALAVFAAAYMGELVIGRFGAGTENGAAPRYVYTNHLLVVGVVFVLADAARTFYASGRRLLGGLLLLSLSAGVGYTEYYNWQIQRMELHAQITAQRNAIAIVKARLAGQQVPYPAWYCPKDELCDQGARFLRQHKLSMFHDDATDAPQAPAP